jgi:hypothetical protein
MTDQPRVYCHYIGKRHFSECTPEALEKELEIMIGIGKALGLSRAQKNRVKAIKAAILEKRKQGDAAA